ncbi:hypothetical protein QE152_g37419 [Popillia japonica]|uniref:Uncharacterized protein n=1 Tax=Popillia japonica TaxID=7064 RepID=A0AAW1IAF0_POPJA
MSRKTQHSKIITSTPVKDELEKKEERKKARPQDVRKVKRNVVSDQKKRKKNTATTETCSVCDNFGGNNDLWWRCRSCGSWAHADCTKHVAYAIILVEIMTYGGGVVRVVLGPTPTVRILKIRKSICAETA